MLPRVKVIPALELLFSISIIRPLSWEAEAAVTHVADGRAQFEKKTSYFHNWRVCAVSQTWEIYHKIRYSGNK